MKKSLILFLIILLGESCVERLTIGDGGNESGTLIVDGVITDEPGPYTIKLFRASSNEAVLNTRQPVLAKEVSISDDTGNTEILSSEGEGVYLTSASGIRGEVGRKYSLHIVMLDGTIFESKQDQMNPVENIDSVYYEWVSQKPLQGQTQYGFKIFMDTRNSGINSYLRWRFSGTFVIESFPHLRRQNDTQCSKTPGPPEPPPCSGYTFSGGGLVYQGECTCCVCWVTDYESKPHLNDGALETDGTYKKVEIGYVPFNEWTFGKAHYMVKIDQMSLTREAYEFWRVFKDQKEGAASLFQPAFGKARTNMYSTNTERDVIGFFYAAALRKKVIFLKADAGSIKVPPYSIEPPIDNCGLWRSCSTIFLNASTTPPKEWN